MITNGFYYVAFLMLVAGGLVALQKYTKWKIFEYVPALVMIYIVNMVFCTIGLFDLSDGSAVNAAYSGVLNPLLYAMIFVLLLQCDFRRLIKLGGRMLTIFLAGTVTIGLGFIIGYPIFMHLIGGGELTWGAVSALYASWVAGTGAMISVGAALGANEGAFACALAVDTVVYTAWVAFMLFLVRYTDKWNKFTKADTSKLDAIADVANAQVEETKTARPTGGDWMILVGIALAVSAVAQWLGGELNVVFASLGLGKSTYVALIVTVVGLICAMTPLGKLPAIGELSTVLMYAVVSLMASTASLTDLVSAPMWLVFGVFILAVHAVLMILLSKIFHWDLAMVATSSVANVGGVVSAPVVSAAFKPSFAGIGVLMGVLGAALGNLCGLGISVILRMIAGC